MSTEGKGNTTYVQYGVKSPKFILAPVYSCTHWMRPRNSPLPPKGSYPPWLIHEGALVSKDVTPWNTPLRNLENNALSSLH